MFDVGFWELILIAIIGLVVLGPERLPVAIRTVRSWIAGVRKFSDNVKSELTEELRIQELHENLKKAEQSNLKDLSPEVAESLKSLQDAAKMVTRPYEKSAGDENGQAASVPEKAPVAQEKLAAASDEVSSPSLSAASSDSVSDSASGSSLDSSLDKEKQKP
ncbi:Sec-independent protein translocase protein TatB [Thalassomonas sp. RHCl1]|uniref:Sec-independent protein translocase protein TatB n=1 Tax=Thalassomonas sp. RHCl1 TaxID=2995320 RepID=UPI00248C5A28|nr:Sec-independent protein translocase protein TatB [Thalassomonas sp. RHCl1]